jgi:hypothetical protein
LALDDAGAVASGARAAPFVPTAMFQAAEDAKAAGTGAGSQAKAASGRLLVDVPPEELRRSLFALFAAHDKLWVQVPTRTHYFPPIDRERKKKVQKRILLFQRGLLCGLCGIPVCVSTCPLCSLAGPQGTARRAGASAASPPARVLR